MVINPSLDWPSLDWPSLDWPSLDWPSLDWGDDGVAQGPEFRILGLPGGGTDAPQITVPARNGHPKPAALSFEEAAALPLAGLTAYRADGLRPVVDRVYPLAEASAAHRRMEEAGQFGKIVLAGP